MDIEYLKQKELQKYITDSLLTTPWVTLYKSKSADVDNETTLYSALVPYDEIEKCMNDVSWDISIGDGAPGFVTYYNSGEKKTVYERNSNKCSIEPIVIFREFHGVKEDYVEIQEELRLFHNLWEDRKRNVFVKINDDGTEEDVITISSDEIKIKTKYIRQYMAARQMGLAIYFDSFRYSENRYTKEEYTKACLEVKEENNCYSLHIGEWDGFSDDKIQSISRLLGKRIIKPPSFDKSGKWPFEGEKKDFENFIIGNDEDGEPVYYTCDHNKLANYFGANPDAPHYLTPVFFKKEVLSKYYNNPEKYTVQDGYLRCGGLWGVRIDNDHSDVVMVFLGDLGRDLSHSEQLYWRSFNILPEGKISSTCFRRSFMAEFTDPASIDLSFKSKFSVFSERFHKEFGWPLFLPLAGKDSHLFTSLRIPMTNDHAEFDSQILAIAKILVDSINEKQIGKTLEGELKELRGISKLGEYLKINKVENFSDHIDFLKDIYALRSSGVGHRKGKRFEKISERFDIANKELKEIVKDILIKAEKLIEDLAKAFFDK